MYIKDENSNLEDILKGVRLIIKTISQMRKLKNREV